MHKELPEHLKQYKIYDLESLKNIHKLIEAEHQQAGFMINLVNNYYKKNINQLSAQELLFISRIDYVEKITLIEAIDKKLDNGMLCSFELVLSLLESNKDMRTSKLFEKACLKGILINVDLDNIKPEYRKMALMGNLNASAAQGKILSEKDFIQTLEVFPLLAIWHEYILIAYKENNLFQVKELIKNNNDLAADIIKTKNLSPEVWSIINRHSPDIILNHANFLSKDKLLDFMKKTYDSSKLKLLEVFISDDLKESIGELYAKNFLMNPNKKECQLFIKYFKEHFCKHINSYNMSDILNERKEKDLSYTLEDSDGFKTLSNNFFIRQIQLNYLQELVLDSKDNIMLSLVQMYPDIINSPIKEEINGIIFEKHIIQFAFENSSYNHIFSYEDLYPYLNETQQMMTVQVLMKQYIENKSELLIKLIPYIENGKNYEKSCYIMKENFSDNSKVQQLQSLYTSIHLQKNLSHKSKLHRLPKI